MKTFAAIFGTHPTASAEAPGRVNLLGEHTGYNDDGYVLTTAIPQSTHVLLRPNEGNIFRVYAANLKQFIEFNMLEMPEEHFGHYIYGCLRQIEELGIDLPKLDIYIASDIPIGLGLSSSAALEVAMLRALHVLLSLPLDDVQIAQLAQRAEIDYAGVYCSLMDQMASSLADTGQKLFLDIRTLEHQKLPLPAGTEILVIDSGVTHTLASDKFNDRRAECAAAAKLLGVAALRDVPDPSLTESLPEPLCRRARHIVSENNRVQCARENISAEKFGQLMNDSHDSLRNNYEVSTPELDELVSILRHQTGVYGARLTGTGFVGTCVALCEQGATQHIGQESVKLYNQPGRSGRLLVPKPPE
jgi:galactokinase